MIKSGLRRKYAKLRYGFLLLFISAALPLGVRAMEEGNVLSSDSAKVYSEMSENSSVTANLIKGNTFQVMEQVRDNEGTVWYKIRTDFGAEGYVKADEVKRLNIEKQMLQQEILENTENSVSNSTDETDFEETESDKRGFDDSDSTENVFERQKEQETGGEVVALANLNLRSMPSARSDVISKVKQGIRLKWFEKIVNDAGENWYKVEYEGTQGYVIAKAVQLVKAQQSEEEKAEAETVLEAEHTMAVTEQEKNAEAETLSEERMQKEASVKEQQQLEPQTVNATQVIFEVEEETDTQREHHWRGIDWMLVVLIVGGLVCIIMIVIFLKKIRKLRRK